VEERLLMLLKRFGLDAPESAEESPVRVMSFSARSLQRVRTVSPTLPTVYLMQFVSPRLRDGRLPAGVRIAGPSIRIVRNHPAYIERLKKADHQVHVWTVNEPQDVDLCVELGVDAIITNRPRAVRHQLGH
jgi:glycerophosphoryl diester phosphodiesterase